MKKAEIILQPFFKNKTVLEIACGTGYWTERIFNAAVSVLATDINQSVIDIGRSKNYPGISVKLETADFYNLNPVTKFDCLFGGFIWSHILLQDLDRFINTVNSFVKPGGQVVFMDNRYVSGSNHPITETDEQGNTFQTRKLDNRTKHRVLKNFPTEDFLRQKLASKATGIEIINLEYYWIMVYETPKNN